MYNQIKTQATANLSHGVEIRPVATLTDGAGVAHIWVDDHCYVLGLEKPSGGTAMIRVVFPVCHIFHEAMEVLRILPPLSNAKEHAPLSAGASVDHEVDVETTGEHVNRAADRGCVSRLVLPSSFSWLAWIAASWVILAPFVGGQSYFQTMDTLRSLWVNYPVTMVLQMAAVGILSARLLATRQEVQATDSSPARKQDDQHQ